MTPEYDSLSPEPSPEPYEKDPFTHHVMKRIPSEVREGLTTDQLKSIAQALYAARPGQNHAVDKRFTIPLFFVRYYVVLMCGRDRRSRTRAEEESRLRKTNHFFDIVLFAILITILLLAFFGIVYLFKSYIGINIMEDKHLLDLLPDI